MSLGVDFSGVVGERVNQIKAQLPARGFRIANELRNSATDVLGGRRSGGRTVRTPYRTTHTASAPGEPPAMRSGALRSRWTPSVQQGSGGVTAAIDSGVHYAGYLQEGTRKMAARPFKEKVIEKTIPRAVAILSEPFF